MPKTLFYPTQIKKLCQYLVQLAEVIPTSSGRSSYPPSALTRGRLAHFVHLRTSVSLNAPTLQSAIPSCYMASFRFSQRWLKAVFPFLFRLNHPLVDSIVSINHLNSVSDFKSIPSFRAKSFAILIHFLDSAKSDIL
ncbi:MAG: hypothetical protein RL264_469 [Bacteroidota bacterium]